MTHINIRSKEEHRTVLPFLSPLAEERAWASFLFFFFFFFLLEEEQTRRRKVGQAKDVHGRKVVCVGMRVLV